MAMKFNKYVTYATVELSDDFYENLAILEDIIDSRIKVLYPLSVVYTGRTFKISSENELIVFYNAIVCTQEVSYERTIDKLSLEQSERESLYHQDFGPISEDYFYVSCNRMY